MRDKIWVIKEEGAVKPTSSHNNYYYLTTYSKGSPLVK